MKITTVTIKEGAWERLWDEVDKKYGIITAIGSDFTTHEMAESARELFGVKTIFARFVKAREKSESSFMIFSKRNLSKATYKVIAQLYNSDCGDDGSVVVKTEVLKALLSKKRYARLFR